MTCIHLLFLLILFLKVIFSQDLHARFRLENNVKPKLYNIKIHPVKAEKYFLGEVMIIAEVQYSLEKITMNSKSLRISSIALDNYINNTKYILEDKNELLHILYEDETYIDPGEHFIYIEFTGPITSDGNGIFQSGDSIGTMFSASYARMAFPCFDDPAYKAKFSVRLVKPDESFKALSNMEEINSFATDGGIAVDFRTTPPISPYLLCFVITKYNNSLMNYRSIDGRLIPIRIFMMDNYVKQAQFLLNIANNSLRFFEEYTTLPYPSSKLGFTLVELPEVFRPEFQNTRLTRKIYSLQTITRQSYIFYQDIHSKNTHPVIMFPNSHEQVEAQFEELIYLKGSAILKMLEMVMGHESFRSGVRNYLKKYRFHTATTGNFISIMQESSQNLNIWGFLQSWLYQNGYPLIFVMKSNYSRNYIVKQKNFAVASDSGSVFGHKWTIPITYTSSCNRNINMRWLDKDAKELYVAKCEDEKWTKFNHNGQGYYRVLYTEEHYQQLLDQFEELTEDDQGNLIDETFHLMRELLVSCEIPLKLMGKLKSSSNLLPILISLKNVKRILTDVKTRPRVFEKLKIYFVHIFERFYDEFSWTVSAKDDFNTRSARSSLLQVLCGSLLKYKKCLDDVVTISKNDSEIHSDIANTFIGVSKIIEVTKQNHTEQKYNFQSILASLFRKKISTPRYVDVCSQWIINNL